MKHFNIKLQFIATLNSISGGLCSTDNLHGQKNTELTELINQYRKTLKLHELKCSKELVETAKEHVNNSDSCPQPEEICKLHSWGSCGKLEKTIKSCCYKDDKDFDCMLQKVREVTGNAEAPLGYEISTYYSGKLTPEIAFQNWRGSDDHDNVMSGNSQWKDMKQIGCYYSTHYAHCWFSN